MKSVFSNKIHKNKRMVITSVDESESVWKSLSHVQLFVTPWTIQSIEFSRPEYWNVNDTLPICRKD